MTPQKEHSEFGISKFWRAAYIVCIVASLMLHVFNELNITEELKFFHITAALACVIVIVFFPKSTKTQILTYGLGGIAILSSALSPYPGAITRAISMVIVIIGCSGLSYVNANKIIKLANILIPIVLVVLYAHFLSLVAIYRYTGFYNDPNYLCTTLMVFEFLIFEYMLRSTKKVIKFLLIFELGLIFMLAVPTLSRTGIVCLLFLVMAYSWELILKYRKIAIISLGIAIAYLVFSPPAFITNSIESFNSREDEHGNFAQASNLRMEIALKGVNYVTHHPEYWLQGLGLGATGHLEYFHDYRGDTHYLDHNTITSTFSETGVIGFFLMVTLFILTLKKNLKKTNMKSPDRLLRICGCLALFVFCLSINQLTYLPFWWMIYLLNNQNLINENIAYNRLRSCR